MEQIFNICVFMCGLCIIVAPIALIVWIIMIVKKSERKKKAKRFFVGTLAGVVLSVAIGVATSPSTSCEHEWKNIEQTVPTCTESGTTVMYCTLCNAKGDEEEIQPTGHAYVDKTVQEATLESIGIEESICSVCGEIKQKELAKLGTKENPCKITVEQLVSEIEADKDTAKVKYNEQWVEITGKVLDASNVAGMSRFYLYGNVDDSGLRIVCWVKEEVLKPFDYDGETHTFIGQIREITTVNATEIGDCEIISK